MRGRAWHDALRRLQGCDRRPRPPAPDPPCNPSWIGARMDVMAFIGWTATVVAILGVWLNNRRRRVCFVLWLVSNAITFGVHAWVAMWSLAARDLAFFVLAVHGWWLWGPNREGEAIREKPSSLGH